jgi:hypothetical protein
VTSVWACPPSPSASVRPSPIPVGCERARLRRRGLSKKVSPRRFGYSPIARCPFVIEKLTDATRDAG